jgi:hypothetical protein
LGQLPGDLTREEGIAYDVASALLHHGTLPELNYWQALEEFGQHGAAELIYLVHPQWLQCPGPAIRSGIVDYEKSP